MGTLLHLSDLHLAGPESAGEVIGDYKVDAVPLAERQRRTSVIGHTLEQLGGALSAAKVDLDAVVITGDVTAKGSQDGFDLLPSVLARLGDSLPEPERIMVVPGNHDVVRGTKPGSAERYARFITLRDNGYRTSYLEGVDADRAGTRRGNAMLEPCITATDDSFVIVGINSCDMCGMDRDTEDDVLPWMTQIEELVAQTNSSGRAVKALYEAWAERGRIDVARVSEAQRALCNLLVVRERAEVIDRGKPAPVMIAAFHHQLRPVSSEEEFTSFEGISNLGEVRAWLAGNHFDILLHGHKHADRVAADLFVPFDEADRSASHRLLVISAPTIGHGQPASNPVARLMTIDAKLPRASELALRSVPSRAAGTPLTMSSMPIERHPIGIDDGSRVGVLEADTADQVYDKILGTIERLHDLPLPLICRFRDGSSALKIPRNYPDVGSMVQGLGGSERADRLQDWFDETVAWWERPTHGSVGTFNHGERIRPDRGVDPSQFNAAIDSLVSKTTTSRALMLLIDPATNFNKGSTPFPAFALVQMFEQNGALTMIGYFRKQEMPHWWPINVAELATLQRDAIAALAGRGFNLEAGAISTITALPVTGNSAPSVVIPEVDRRVETPAALLELVIPLYYGGTSPREMEQRWRRVLDDWRPREHFAADSDPVPVQGFSYLAELAQACQALNEARMVDATLGARLITELQQLRNANHQYAADQLGSNRAERHAQWRVVVDTLIPQILATVNGLAAAGSADL